VINLIWGSSFKRAYKKVTVANPDLKPKIAQALETDDQDVLLIDIGKHDEIY